EEVQRAEHVVLAPPAPVPVRAAGLGELLLDRSQRHPCPFVSSCSALPPAIAARAAGSSPAASSRRTGSSIPTSNGWSVPSTTRSAPTTSTRCRSARGVYTSASNHIRRRYSLGGSAHPRASSRTCHAWSDRPMYVGR